MDHSQESRRVTTDLAELVAGLFVRIGGHVEAFVGNELVVHPGQNVGLVVERADVQRLYADSLGRRFGVAG
ncbi:hypothetical protein ACIBAG_38075 [Streptomyces sp. NPDC051243]|uniref:hypothetical protein n=1 Tax=Streptomyces sp. NPDC051243 TaxID=3365646 RepID=UPI00378E481C